MNREDFFNTIASHDPYVSALSWHGYKERGRGAVVIEFSNDWKVDNLWYCVTDNDLPSDNAKDLINEYKPESDVCVIGLNHEKTWACVGRYSPRIPPHVAAEYCQDVLTWMLDQAVFNTQDVVM